VDPTIHDLRAKSLKGLAPLYRPQKLGNAHMSGRVRQRSYHTLEPLVRQLVGSDGYVTNLWEHEEEVLGGRKIGGKIMQGV